MAAETHLSQLAGKPVIAIEFALTPEVWDRLMHLLSDSHNLGGVVQGEPSQCCTRVDRAWFQGLKL